jgi:hypothetical protein
VSALEAQVLDVGGGELGEVPYDPRGVYGRAVIWAFRLVDVKLLKAALADSTGVLAIIASRWFLEEVVKHAANGIPSIYRRVLVRAKESTQPGWICLPDAGTALQGRLNGRPGAAPR